MSSPRAIFRADASPRLGGGHVMRCLTLARELLRRGWCVDFATNSGAADALRGIPLEGIGWHEGFDEPASDAEALRARFGNGTSLLVIDHYGWNALQESALRDFAPIRLAFDDFTDRQRDADIILDSNIGARAEPHRAVSRSDALILAGPEYAQLRAEFAQWGAWRINQRSSEPATIQRIVLGFGLTDLGGMTARAAETLLAILPQITIDAIIGPAAPSRAKLEFLSGKAAINVHIAPPNVAEIMARADIAVGASGQSAYERCCLGLPSIGLSIVENQIFLIEELERAGASIHVPAMAPGWENAMCEAVLILAGDAAARGAMSLNARRICDGQGAARVADAIDARRETHAARS